MHLEHFVPIIALMTTRIGRVGLILLILVFWTLMSTGPISKVFAADYGGGFYGGCGYQINCPQSSPPTTVVTPTGLQVSINLSNGQSTPIKGYTIIMTPLNGQGTSFKSAAIYINSNLIQTVTPAETGTASWLWVPQSLGATDVKIIITDTNDATTTQEFSVNVTASRATVTQHTTEAPTNGGGQDNIIQTAYNRAVTKATQIVKALPSPVVHAFPYILFILLGIDVLVVFIQTQRELRQYNILQNMIERARRLDETKQTFAQLASHYLRTPLTVLSGGIDIMTGTGQVSVPVLTKLKTISEDMKIKINDMISGADKVVSPSNEIVLVDARKAQLWRQPGLIVPIILIALAWVAFDYLAARAGKFSVGQIEIAAQAIVFTAVALVTYMAFRYRQVSQRNSLEQRRIMDNEESIIHARDDLIANVILNLNKDVESLDVLTSQLNGTKQTHAVQEAAKRFHELLTRFSVAGQIQGSRSARPYAPLDVQDLAATCGKGLQTKIDAKSLTINGPDQAMFMIQEPELFEFVLSSVLDNAVAYSHEKGTIHISTALNPTEFILKIEDQGTGIPADKLALLFQPFSKTEGAEVFNHEGIGFSLYLDKLILNYLGGSIELTSELGHGTTVTLHLPQLN